MINQTLYAFSKTLGGQFEPSSCGEKGVIRWFVDQTTTEHSFIRYSIEHDTHELFVSFIGEWEPLVQVAFMDQLVHYVNESGLSLFMTFEGVKRTVYGPYESIPIGPLARKALACLGDLYSEGYLPNQKKVGGWITLYPNAKLGNVSIYRSKEKVRYGRERNEHLLDVSTTHEWADYVNDYERRVRELTSRCEASGLDFHESCHPDFPVCGIVSVHNDKHAFVTTVEEVEAFAHRINQQAAELNEAKERIKSTVRQLYPTFEWGEKTWMFDDWHTFRLREKGGIWKPFYFNRIPLAHRSIESAEHQFNVMWDARVSLHNELKKLSGWEPDFPLKVKIEWGSDTVQYSVDTLAGWELLCCSDPQKVFEHFKLYIDRKRASARAIDALATSIVEKDGQAIKSPNGIKFQLLDYQDVFELDVYTHAYASHHYSVVTTLPNPKGRKRIPYANEQELTTGILHMLDQYYYPKRIRYLVTDTEQKETR